MRRTGILFDVDGTLTDTNHLHVTAWWRAFADAGHPVAAARILRCIGMGGPQMLDALLPDAGEEVHEQCTEGWRRGFEALKGEIRPLPGAVELLRAVHDRGAIVVLATSSEEDDVDALLAALGADDAIDGVTCSGDVDAAKPEPDVFGVALDKGGLRAADALVVGDTVWDAVAARRAGLGYVGLRSGGIGAGDLTDAGALAVYDDAAALLADLDASPLGALLVR